MRVEWLADVAPERWDALVSSASDASVCHLAGWREVFADVLRHECRYGVAVDGDGTWLGALPLVHVRGGPLGHYLVSLPFLNYGGAVGTEEARAALAHAAVEEARSTGADLLELRSRRAHGGDLRSTDRKILVLLDLPERAATLWDAFPGKLRSQIRRPLKEGMEARLGLDQLEPFYQVFARHMHELGTPVLPRAFFERIAALFPGSLMVGAVYAGGRPVAAGCGFLWRNEFEMTWASSLRQFDRAAPNMLLYWAFMEQVIAQGGRVFNFGRCSPGGGTHRFKRQWGGHDAPLPWAQWSARAVAAPPSPDRPLFRLASACWRRLPAALANRLGPRIARCLP